MVSSYSDQIKIQHVFHTGANCKYLWDVLAILNERKDIKLWMDKISHYFNRDADVLLYQTFPDENNTKFNPKLIEQTDKIFKEFQGLKILVCTHDNGDTDSYPRFNDKTLPRIKTFPTKRFMEEYNVILTTGPSTMKTPDCKYICSTDTFKDEHKRDITISCKFGHVEPSFYKHGVRLEVFRCLNESFKDITDFSWEDGKEALLESLKRTLIAIGCPGYGQHTDTHQLALRTGALLFSHVCIGDIYYLPHYDLVDGRDYVSFDCFNFTTKLKRLLADPDRIETIRNNGRRAFKMGYSPTKSADQLYNYLREMKNGRNN